MQVNKAQAVGRSSTTTFAREVAFYCLIGLESSDNVWQVCVPGRIAIARALLKRPKILIFDEATSNLDEDTANAFGETINALKGKVTIVLIAHRLPTHFEPNTTVVLGRDA